MRGFEEFCKIIGQNFSIFIWVKFVRGIEIQCHRTAKLDAYTIQIIAEGSTLQIITRQCGSRTIEVPGAYLLAGAHAMYLKGRLRIVVPKAGTNSVPKPN